MPVPHFLKHRHILKYSAFLVLAKVLLLAAVVLLPPYFVFSDAITPGNIIRLTNAARLQTGLHALIPNDALTRAAEAKAADMLKNQYFAHTSPSGTSAWSWIRAEGYTYLYSGENLAVHYETAEHVQGGWMASPSHRANILNPRFTEIGVGVASGDFEGVPSTFVVETFGFPAPTGTVAARVNPPQPEAEVEASGTRQGSVLAASSVRELYHFNEPEYFPVGLLLGVVGTAAGLVLIFL